MEKALEVIKSLYPRMRKDEEAYIRLSGTEQFVDVSGAFYMAGALYENIYGPLNSGKSTLLSAFRSYYSDEYDTGEEFAGSEYDVEHPKRWEMNKHPVIFLDFSDFEAKTLEHAVQFLRVKMSGLYLSLLERCAEELSSYHNAWERYLDIIEGKQMLEYKRLTCYNKQRNAEEVLFAE